MLNYEEFKRFFELHNSNRVARGISSRDLQEITEKQWQDYYDLHNGRNKWEDGVALVDLLHPDSVGNALNFMKTELFDEIKSAPFMELEKDGFV